MNKWVFTILAIALTSCSRMSDVANLPSNEFIVRSEISPTATPIHFMQHAAVHPNWMTYIDDIDQFQITYPHNYPKEKPIFMSGMSMKRIDDNCSTTITGASQMIDIPNTRGATSWGKFDYEFSPDPKIGEGQFYCAPFSSTPHLYVLCSEKDKKTVLICVSQATDNPDLARKIFETFRWTK